MLLLGDRLAERDAHGSTIEDDDLLILLNAHHELIDFRLPEEGWRVLVDTAAEPAPPGQTYPLKARSLALLAKPRSRGPARTGA
jgi:glycogen operon protein